MQINPLKAKVNISERYYPSLKKGMRAAVKVDIYPDRQFRGEVFRIYPTISADTRTFPVELVISNPDEILRPGMFARVSLDLGETSSLVVPAAAVVKQEGTNERYVYLANDGHKARKIKVTLGERYDDKVEIISDQIREGDQLIYSGQEKLMDGSSITVVQ